MPRSTEPARGTKPERPASPVSEGLVSMMPAAGAASMGVEHSPRERDLDARSLVHNGRGGCIISPGHAAGTRRRGRATGWPGERAAPSTRRQPSQEEVG